MKTLLALIGFLSIAHAETKPTPQYRLDIRMLETAASQTPPKESRYMILLQAGTRAILNANERLAYYSFSKKNAERELHTIDLGTIFDFIVHYDGDSGTHLECGFESSFASRQAPHTPSGLPQIQSRKARTTAIVPLGKEVEMAQLDDPTTGNRLQFFVVLKRIGE